MIIYLTRLPPSESGVARYAADFLAVLRTFDDVQVVPLPSKPASSQRLRTMFRTLGHVFLLRARHGRSGTVVWVELAGRGTAELFVGAAACALFNRVYCTVHDAPEVTGGIGYISLLDRRGLRRLAAFITDYAGRQVETWCISRFSQAFALSRSGANGLAIKYARTFVAIPHVVVTPKSGRHKPLWPSIYLPGRVSGSYPFTAVAEMLSTSAAHGGSVLLGLAEESTSEVFKSAVVNGDSRSLVQLDFLTESQIDSCYHAAAIVLRLIPEGGIASANSLAVGGPVLRAQAHGCVVVTNDRRATCEYLDAGGGVLVDSFEEGLRAAAALASLDSATLQEIGEQARQRHLRTTSVEVVRQAIALELR